MVNNLKKAFPNYLKILEGKQKPKFQVLKEKGILDEKIEKVKEILKNCQLCERRCRVNRLGGEFGFCQTGLRFKIFGAHTHLGEEAELIPSATLFMAGCTMRCVYCQNAPQSINPELGEPWTEKQAAEFIETKFREGCKNVNFVGGDPTPYLYNILKCLNLCKVNIPVVWNSNTYYSEETASILKELVDIYLLDFRYFSDKCALKFSSAPNYLHTLKRNLLLVAKDSELLIRVLVLPGHINCDAKPILKWIRDNLNENVRVNIMRQYYPAWHAYKFSEVNRRLTLREYNKVVSYAKKIGLKNIITQ